MTGNRGTTFDGMGQFSSNLFAEPSFLEGMARVLDLGNTLNEYNRCLSGELTDYYAILGDWRAVGNEIQQAAHQRCCVMGGK
jgi:hypothetical protein